MMKHLLKKALMTACLIIQNNRLSFVVLYSFRMENLFIKTFFIVSFIKPVHFCAIYKRFFHKNIPLTNTRIVWVKVKNVLLEYANIYAKGTALGPK